MTDQDALLRSVLPNPDDDAPRLVYADWLEERGRAEDAEFIRVQIEFDRLVGVDGAFHVNSQSRLQRIPAHIERLQRRQTELWRGGAGRPDLPSDMSNWTISADPFSEHSLFLRRGFIEAVRVVTNAFLRVAGRLFARQPVAQVRLIDRHPSRIREGFGWAPQSFGNRPDQVPDELWPFVLSSSGADRVFPTADAAEVALSTACVKYGRVKAGLTDGPEVGQ
jgi:uncharacterized protein (TIGR02996 family)